MADFCTYDALAGGPDSHMTTIAHMSRHLPPEERAWWGCVYVAVYNVPQALAILHTFPTRYDISGVRTWIAEHWPHIVLRRERRRPVGSPTKLAECLESAAAWIDTDRLASAQNYDVLWVLADQIKYFGRYAKIKVLEVLRRQKLTEPIIPDLRASGGWSPREGLALLWPEHEITLNSGNNAGTLRKVESIAAETRQILQLDQYCTQVFLCDYKQCVNGRQYPGRSLDSELTHHAKVASHFGEDNSMFLARAELFPSWALGEVRGWTGVREDLTECYAKYGYMWSDSKFAYPTDVAAPKAL